MAGLRELRKRLASIRTTGQLAGAMRSAAAAKYARVNAMLSAYSAYDTACREMRRRLGGGTGAASAGSAHPAMTAPECLVVMAGNRGLCGGYNQELLRYFSERYEALTVPPSVIACGKMSSAYCHGKSIAPVKEFPVSDVPTYAEAQALSACVTELYRTGTVSGVTFVCQRFDNMLRQTPESRRLLPAAETDAQADEEEVLLLPDREVLVERLFKTCMNAAVYKILLENAAGAQAATLLAMRSAFDNATESAAKLETAINRRRQAEVTESVIETSAENVQ